MTTITSGAPLPPERIRDAIVRVTDPAFPIHLSPAVRLALTYLLRRVEVRNGHAEFWVKRMNFAEIVGRCDKTISNWMNELEASGLIVKEQARTHWGAFRCLTVHLTELAVRLLELGPREQDSSANRKKSSHVTYTEQSKENTLPSSVETKTVGKGSPLPDDLQSLVCETLSKNAVFKLMGLATKAGKRLSSIVAVAKQHIQKSSNKFAYVKSLIRIDKDWDAISQKVAADEDEKATDAKKVDNLRHWSALTGMTLHWGKLEVIIGEPYQPCMCFSITPNGRREPRGMLAGSPLLELIAASIPSRLLCAEQTDVAE